MEYLEGEKIYGVYNCFFLFAVMPASVAGYYLIKLLGNRNERWSDWLSNLFLVLVSLCFYGWARLGGIALLSIYVLGVWMAGKGICYLEKKAKYKRKVCFMTLSILAVTGIFDLVQVLQFYCGKSKSFFRHQSGDESVDRSSWNFFHHVYSDILSCGCLSWRCRGGKPFGCILYLSFSRK